MSQPLTVVSEESIAGRTIAFHNAGPIVMVRGAQASAPDLICGKCSQVLVQGVAHGRFVDPVAAQAVGIRLLRLTPPIGKGPITISNTLPVKNATDHIEAIVLCCPNCRALNDTFSEPGR